MLTVILAHLAIVLAGTCFVLTVNKLSEEKDSEGVIYFVLTVVFIFLSIFAFMWSYYWSYRSTMVKCLKVDRRDMGSLF